MCEKAKFKFYQKLILSWVDGEMNKNSISSLINFFQRRINKLVRYRPPPHGIAIILMFSSIFLISGGVYDVVMKPRSVLPYYRGFLFLYPSLHEQVLNESIAVMIIYIFGAIGLLLIYQSTKYIRDPNQASLLIKLGASLLILTFILLEAVLYLWKLGYGF